LDREILLEVSMPASLVTSAANKSLYLAAGVKTADIFTLWEVTSKVVPHLGVEVSHEQVPELY
jgi:hypothetical protein